MADIEPAEPKDKGVSVWTVVAVVVGAVVLGRARLVLDSECGRFGDNHDGARGRSHLRDSAGDDCFLAG